MRVDLRYALGALALSWLPVLAGPAAGQTLYWIDTLYPAPTIGRASADVGGAYTVPLSAGTLPEDVDVVAETGQVYWTESAWSGARIMRADDYLGGATAVVSGGSSFRGIAVDATAGRMYWTSSNLVSGAKLHRAHLDGSAAQVLLNFGTGGFNPRGIALDVGGGAMYWADFDRGTIRRAALDGTALVDLLEAAGPWGVALDLIRGKIYWTDYVAGSIGRANLDGTASQDVLTGLGNPTYLAIDAEGRRMFWSEATAGAQRVRSANLDGTGVLTLAIPAVTYGGIAYAATIPTAAAEPSVAAFGLGLPSPNPMPGSTRIEYTLPSEAQVMLNVLDIQGREVAVLAKGIHPPGRHQATWTGRIGQRTAPSGIYFVRYRAAGKDMLRRLVIAR